MGSVLVKVKAPQRWKLAAGPKAAMQCCLMDLGFSAPNMDCWTRDHVEIRVLALRSRNVRRS